MCYLCITAEILFDSHGFQIDQQFCCRLFWSMIMDKFRYFGIFTWKSTHVFFKSLSALHQFDSNALAIMQRFRDKEQNRVKIAVILPVGIYFCKSYHDHPCVKLHISLKICIIFVTHIYYKIQLTRSLPDIVYYPYQIKRKYIANFFIKRANKHFFFSHRSNVYVGKKVFSNKFTNCM